MQACALRNGSAAPDCEPAALPSDALKHLRSLAAAMLCASAQSLWGLQSFFVQESSATYFSAGGVLAAPAAMMRAAKEKSQAGVRNLHCIRLHHCLLLKLKCM